MRSAFGHTLAGALAGALHRRLRVLGPVRGAGRASDTARVVRVVDGDTIRVALPAAARSACATSGSTRRSRSSPARRCECFAKRGERVQRAARGRRARAARASTPRRATATGGCSPTSTASATACSSTPSWCAAATRPSLTIPPNVAHARGFRRLAARPARTRRRSARALWTALRGSSIIVFAVPMRMRQSLAEIEEAFVEEIEEDRERRERLARRAEQRDAPPARRAHAPAAARCASAARAHAASPPPSS